MRHDLVPVVAVPARNEEARLPPLIRALGRQVAWGGAPGSLQVVVVLNNCTDRSREAAQAAANACPGIQLILAEVALPDAVAHVGTARRLAMEMAADLVADRSGGVILTTDADAVPADDWVSATLASIANGVDLVGGRISGDQQEEARLGPAFLRRARAHAMYDELCDELASLLDPLPHDPWPRHRDHTGASLAVRVDVYRTLGGLDPLPFREDLAFVSKARAAGFLLAHPPGVNVTVSARLSGRAPGGMADCLKAWMRAEAQGEPILVEAPEAVVARFRRRSALRALAALPPGAARPPLLDLGGAPEGLPAAALVERLAPDEPDAPPTVLVEIACMAVREYLAILKGSADAA
ncbi:glycosyltransferase [Aureimonas populi]|uniref:Glycosyltransferase n=1 Tax=Aureimonas populi TaxID=1701758 RepID=A0ABW5CHB5_9HYPH|nr:glycosyltransferase [Aureimonas populi]